MTGTVRAGMGGTLIQEYAALVNTDFMIELNNTVFYTFQFDLQLVFRFTRFLLCWKMDGAGLCDWLIVLDVTISDFLKTA